MLSPEIICGDCVTVMNLMADDYVDLTITSPPYDNLRNYNGFEWDFEATAKELYRVTKPGGVVVWVVGDATINGSESGTSFRQALFFKEECKFNLHDTMIYEKLSYMPKTHNRYEQAFEFMFIFSKGRPKTFNPIMLPCLTAGTLRNRGGSKARESAYSERKRAEKTLVSAQKQAPNIFRYHVGKNDKTFHNAPFPENLVRDHVLSWSNQNDLVFDPFLGSGTTAKVAIQLNRRFVGCDISPEYVNLAKSRLLDVGLCV